MPKPLTSKIVNKVFNWLTIEDAKHTKELRRENPVIQMLVKADDIRPMRYNTAIKKFGPLYTL